MPIKNKERAQENLNLLLSGKYGSNGLVLHAKKMALLALELQTLAPDEAARVLEMSTKIESTSVLTEHAPEPDAPRTQPQLFHTVGSTETALEYVEACTELMDKAEQVLPSVPEQFRPFMQQLLVPLDWRRGDGIGTYMDDPFFSYAMDEIVQLVPQYKMTPDGGQIDFEKTEQRLRGENNDGPFEPLRAFSESYISLWEAEFERRRLLSVPHDRAQEQAYFDKLLAAGEKMLAASQGLTDAEKKHPNQYTNKDLANALDESLGITEPGLMRTINPMIGMLGGMVQAGKNGWPLSEVHVLAELGENLGIAGQNLRYAEKQIAKTEAALENERNSQAYQQKKQLLEQEYEQLQDELEQQKKQLEEAKNRQAEESRNVNKQRRNAYSDYEKSTAKQIQQFTKEDAERIQKNFRENKGIEQKIAEISGSLADNRKKLDAAEKAHQEKLRSMEENLRKAKQDQQSWIELQEGCNALKDKIWEKKITCEQDKREVLGEISAFKQKYGSCRAFGDGNETLAEYSRRVYGKTDEKTRDSVILGMTPFYQASEMRPLMDNLIGFYGTDPKYNPKWKSGAISEEDYYRDYKPYPYDAGKLPFSQREIAVLGMAATMSMPDGQQLYEQIAPGPMGKERFQKNNTMWMEDMFMYEDGPRMNSAHHYSPIIQAGKDFARDAMEQYAAGNKQPLAEIMQKAILDEQEGLRTSAGISRASYFHYTLLNTCKELMQKDPELAQAFEEVNYAQQPEKRVNMKQMDEVLNVSERYISFKQQQHDINAEIRQKKNALAAYRNQHPGAQAELEHREEELQKLRERSLRLSILDDVFSKPAVGWSNHIDTFMEVGHTALDRMQAKQEEIAAQMQNEDAVSAQVELMMDLPLSAISDYKRSHYPQQYGILFLGTEEGQRAAEEFAGRMYEKYGEQYASNEGYQNECRKFMYEGVNRQIITELEDQPLTVAQRKEYTRMYMENLLHAQACGKAAENGGQLPHDYEILKQPEEYGKFTGQINKFLNTVDFSDMDGREFGSFLKNSEEILLQTAADIQTGIVAESYRSLRPDKPQYLEQGIAALKSERLFGRGSDEYANILKDLTTLNQDLKKEDEAYQKNGTYAGEELTKREDELIQRMKKYLERKQAEFDKVHEASAKKYEEAKDAWKRLRAEVKNKPELEPYLKAKESEMQSLQQRLADEKAERKGENTNSVRRYDAMKLALAELTQRRSKDVQAPTITAEALQSAEKYRSNLAINSGEGSLADREQVTTEQRMQRAKDEIVSLQEEAAQNGRPLTAADIRRPVVNMLTAILMKNKAQKGQPLDYSFDEYAAAMKQSVYTAELLKRVQPETLAAHAAGDQPGLLWDDLCEVKAQCQNERQIREQHAKQTKVNQEMMFGRQQKRNPNKA